MYLDFIKFRLKITDSYISVVLNIVKCFPTSKASPSF